MDKNGRLTKVVEWRVGQRYNRVTKGKLESGGRTCIGMDSAGWVYLRLRGVTEVVSPQMWKHRYAEAGTL
jgi:hypothetical protein